MTMKPTATALPPFVVIASGPSLTDGQLDIAMAARARGACKAIAVNNTCQRAPWADVVYFGDYLAVREYLPRLKARCAGQWWTGSKAAAERWGLQFAKTSGRPGLGKDCVHLNGNSGMQAVNLAVLMGARKVLLLGFDMRLGPAGQKHWFGDHPMPLVQELQLEEWIKKAGFVAQDAAERGIDIVNCTPGSALRCFRAADLAKELSA